MIYIETNSTDVYFNFALEYYVMNELKPKETAFLFWRTEPTVMIGKYQNTLEEINYDFVRENNINIVRRLSGGGTIYTDLGGWQFTFISKKQKEEIDFFSYISPIMDSLKDLNIKGLNKSGRNDLHIGDKKFSGNAQYVHDDYIVHHGSLLFDTNIDNIIKSTTVDSYKIISKGIKSIRERVCNISDHMDTKISALEFKEKMVKSIMKSEKYPEYKLSEKEIEKIKIIAKEKFDSFESKFAKNMEADIEKISRLEGGKFEVKLKIDKGKIKDSAFFGDFFANIEINLLSEALKGVVYDKKSIREAILEHKLDKAFFKINLDELVDAIV